VSTLDKEQLRRRGRELRALIAEWDPIGVGPDWSKDEYDCLLWPVMRKLEDRASEKDLASFLRAELEEHFGLEPDDAGIARFVSQAQEWFDTRWKDTRV
jgi:hypothetical protein